MEGTRPVRPRDAEAGFSLMEALMAVLLLSFGLVAVANLFIVSASSNQIANQSSATVTQANEVLERLKAIPFSQLTTGGNLEANAGSNTSCNDDATNCVIAGNFNATRQILGVGRIRTRWSIARPGAGGPDTLFIRVRSEAIGTLSGSRTRTEYSSFRTCTLGTEGGCPF